MSVDIPALAEKIRQMGLESWADVLPQQLEQRLLARPHGDSQRWYQAIAQLPVLPTGQVNFEQGLVQIGAKPDSDPAQRALIEQQLRELHPWRKGPFQLHGVFIDTEWRSDWKWERVAPYLAPLQGRRVLDVGCGNGYHLWRMLGAGADAVVGIDPTQLFMAQFHAVARLLSGVPNASELLERVAYLPLGIEDVPSQLQAFDSVFSMGVLYHRRSPIDHLYELKEVLRPSGELILETLVIEGADDQVLIPEGRYAKMRNVWFIPSIAQLERWLRRAGFKSVRTVDVTMTSLEEQRATDWMQFESLADFLDPADRSLTVEGYPAPCRAVVLAEA